MNKGGNMFEVKLPKQPIDRYRLDWYQLSLSESWCYIGKKHAIYYVDTPYEEVGKSKGGVPLVDDWMIYEDGCAVGRWCGWKTPSENPYKYWENCFDTEREATEEAITRLNKMIGQQQEKVASLKKLVKQVAMK